MKISYKTDIRGVDWHQLKTTLQQDGFDNGRTPDQLEKSFSNSYAVCLAMDGRKVVGTARILSDGICNAYLVDVWTLSSLRHQGIATKMIQTLINGLNGQHIYLQTDSAAELFAKLGFKAQPLGMGMVVGTWLENEKTPTGSKRKAG